MIQILADLLWALMDEQVVDIWDREHKTNIFSGPLEQLPFVQIRRYLYDGTRVLSEKWRHDGSVEIVIDADGK